MFTTGSKIFYGMAGIAFLAAALYGIVTNGIDHGGVIHVLTGPGAVNAVIGPISFGYKGGVGEHIGYITLMGLALSSFGMGIAMSAFRDADARSLAELDGTDTASVVLPTVTLNAWPFVGSLAAIVAMIGLASSPILFLVGCVAAAITAVEWTVSNIADRQTADARVNRLIRNRIMLPIEIPVGGAILILSVAICLSQILLAISKDGAVVFASVLLVVIFGVTLLLNSRAQSRRSLVIGTLVVGALLVLGLGIGGAVAGPREFEKHSSHEGAAGASSTVTQKD